MDIKRNLTFFFFLLTGIIMGALAASLAAGVPWLDWLAFQMTMGIPLQSPLVLDFSVLRLSVGLEFGINVAQCITVTCALLLYKRIAKKL